MLTFADIGFVKGQMQALAVGRRVRPTESGYELKEPCASCYFGFDGKKIDIERENACFLAEYSVESDS